MKKSTLFYVGAIMFSLSLLFYDFGINASDGRAANAERVADSLRYELDRVEADRHNLCRLLHAQDYALRFVTSERWQYVPCQEAVVGRYEMIKDVAYRYYSDSSLARYD